MIMDNKDNRKSIHRLGMTYKGYNQTSEIRQNLVISPIFSPAIFQSQYNNFSIRVSITTSV